MSDLEKQNSIIVTEANGILYDGGLLGILGKYGSPSVTGSYILGLMAWRDLDIYLESNEMTVGRFFQLGADVASGMRPQRMNFRNEFLGRTPGLPLGFYWGVYVSGAALPVEWKIDIWAIDSEQLKTFQKSMSDLKVRITDESRQAILEIKNQFWRHPEYHKKFASVDIYRAVLEENVRSVREFATWLNHNKGIT